MKPTSPKRNRRFWLFVALAVLGVAYSVFATRYWMSSWISLIPLMDQSMLFRLIFGPLWFAIQLIPITVAVTLLRVRPPYAVTAVATSYIIMCATEIASESWNYGLLLSMVVNSTPTAVIQFLMWGLSALAGKLAGPVP